MKKLKKLFALGLVLCLSAAVLLIPAEAADANGEAQVIRLEDGSYVIVTIEYDQLQSEAAPFSAQSITSGTKSYEYYNSTDELAWVFRVHGTFTYDGRTAEATAAACSHAIYDSRWSFVEGSASYSGDTATATGNFKLFIFSPSATLTLTCSPDGELS